MYYEKRIPLSDSTERSNQKGDKRFYTMIFTNGKLVTTQDSKVYTSEDLLKVNFFSDGDMKNLASKLVKFYPMVDAINVHYVSALDADYVIKVFVSEEFLRTRNGGGWYHVIQKKDVYMKNLWNREANRYVRGILKMFNEQSISSFRIKYPEIKFDELDRVEAPVRKRVR